MLLHNDGYFSCGEVSFKLPDGIYVDTNTDEVCGQGFLLVSPDESFRILIDIKSKKLSAYETLALNFNGELSYRLIGEIESISHGGLCGYKALFENDKSLNEEYIFEVRGEEQVLIDVFVLIHKNSSCYDEEFKDATVAKILDSIKFR